MRVRFREAQGNGGAAGRTEEKPRREAGGRGEREPQAPQASRAAVASGTSNPAPTRPRRRWLSAQKKFDLFLECSIPGAPIGEILRREGLYSSDLVRIREHVREGAIDRLKQGPGRKRKTLSPQEVERLRGELQEKEQALASLSVEYIALKKGSNRVSRDRSVAAD